MDFNKLSVMVLKKKNSPLPHSNNAFVIKNKKKSGYMRKPNHDTVVKNYATEQLSISFIGITPNQLKFMLVYLLARAFIHMNLLLIILEFIMFIFFFVRF